MKRSKIWVFLGITVSIFILSLPSCTPTVEVIKTGQTTCYSTNGDPISCAGTRQDGEYQAGKNWPNSRFTVNVDNNDDGDCTDPGERCDGTVTDNLTGLIWLKNANCAKRVSGWASAFQDVVQLNTDGTMNGNDCGDISNNSSHQTDWRLPNIRELHSLIDYAYFSPALSNGAGDAQWTEDDVFSGVQSSNYWSSSGSAEFVGTGWFVDFNYGGIFINKNINLYKDYSYVPYYQFAKSCYVWPVRGRQ